MCESCPFRHGNDQEFGAVITSLKKFKGDKTPASARESKAARFRVKAERLFTGEFCCHHSVYDADMSVKSNHHWKQCRGAAEYFRGNFHPHTHTP